ncbi:hypothetical protein [Nonomuraea sp. SBT364]|uniref:hypothetical protein n=1 Tax=Nonomuraea sp. SBT364 TaxID=1580530 RepID=UPI0012E20A6E|nr:hypothetical protein [Nonomuraea sp. SBT364]
MSKRVTTWTAAATILSASLAASTALPAFGGTSTTADKTKTLSFRGMNITVPSEWKVTKDKRWDILHVETKPNCDPEKTGCPSFRIGGPKMIHGSKDPNWIGEVYKPGDYPFHPETRPWRPATGRWARGTRPDTTNGPANATTKRSGG